MSAIEWHIFELIKLIIIVSGPIPLCLLFIRQSIIEGDENNYSHYLLSVITLWVVSETGIGLLLGLSGLFNIYALLLIELILLLIGYFLFSRIKKKIQPFPLQELISRCRNFGNNEIIIIGSLFLVFCLFFWRIIVEPITELDSISYHLPHIVKWYQSGSFEMMEQYPQISRYPFNWEVLCALFVIPFGEDFLVALPNLLAWLMFGLAVYNLSNVLGSNRLYSMAAAALILTLPIIEMDHVNKLHVDLPLAAFFLSGLYFIIYNLRSRHPEVSGSNLAGTQCSSKGITLVVLSIGMVMGIKTTGLIYGLLLGITFIFLEYANIQQSKTRLVNAIKVYKTSIWSVLSISMIFILIGGFWYLKNVIETGNPIGPISIAIGGYEVLAGETNFTYYRDTSLLFNFILSDNTDWKMFFYEIFQWLNLPFFIIVLSVFSLPFLLLKSTKLAIKQETYCVLIILIIAGVIYLVTPCTGLPSVYTGMGFRFGFCFIGLLGVVSAVALSVLKPKAEIITAIVVVCCYNVIGNYRFISVAVVIIFIFILLRHILPDRFIVLRKHWVTWLLVISSIAMIILSFNMRNVKENKLLKAYGYIYSHISKYIHPNETIGYIGRNRSYLLYGNNLKRKVIYAPSECDSLEQWLEKLHKSGIDVIAYLPEGRDDTTCELNWLVDPDGTFVRVFGHVGSIDPVLYRWKRTVTITN